MQNKQLLREIAQRGCINHPNRAADPAHIKSRGAGGEDIEENVVPLCRECHTIQHQYGWVKFLRKRPFLRIEMEKKGWIIYQDRLVRQDSIPESQTKIITEGRESPQVKQES